jgi:hypothetical protein
MTEMPPGMTADVTHVSVPHMSVPYSAMMRFCGSRGN